MTMLRSNIVRLCLSMILSAGIAMLLLSQSLLQVIPYARLDAILTRQQLADQAYREATLVQLQRAQEDLIVVCTGTALLLITLSVLGLCAGRRQATDGHQ